MNKMHDISEIVIKLHQHDATKKEKKSMQPNAWFPFFIPTLSYRLKSPLWKPSLLQPYPPHTHKYTHASPLVLEWAELHHAQHLQITRYKCCVRRSIAVRVCCQLNLNTMPQPQPKADRAVQSGAWPIATARHYLTHSHTKSFLFFSWVGSFQELPASYDHTRILRYLRWRRNSNFSHNLSSFL